jgi:hypothetical protein
MVLVRPDQGTPELTVGIGREATVLTYQATEDPPYYVSWSGLDGDDVWYAFDHERSFHAPFSVVGWDEAMKAVEQFLSEPRTLPSAIEWEKL